MTENTPVNKKQKDLDFETLASPQESHREEEIGVLIAKDENLQSVVFDRILLNPGITKSNFYTMCAYVMYLGFILISFSTLEPEFVSELGIPKEHLGKATAGLYLFDYLIRLVFALGYGLMIDYFGRKTVMFIGLILTSLGYFVIPLITKDVFPDYFIGKSIFSAGIIALQMLPLQADYVHNSTKGIMAGVSFAVGFMGGALSAASVKLLRTFEIRYRTIFFVLSGTLLVVGMLLSLGIKGGNKYFIVEKVEEESSPAVRKVAKWKEVKKAFREVPWVTIAIIFGILGNTDLYVMTTGLIIWIKSLVVGDVDAAVIITTYQGLFFGLSVITTIVLALKVDKIPHMKLIFPILIFATLGFIPIPFISDPYSILLYVFMVIEGISLPGVFVYSTYLSIRYNPPEIRGTLSGISNGISFVGAIIVLSAGGFLHDHWRKDASFIIYWILLFSTLVLVSIIYKLMIAPKKKGTRRSKGDAATLRTMSTRPGTVIEQQTLKIGE